MKTGPQSMFPNMGFGLGFRPEYHRAILDGKSPLQWFEVIAENYMVDGGKPLEHLERLRSLYPIAFHGVAMNLGSVDPLNKKYLHRYKELITRFEPSIISDHLCWTGVNGENTHDLLPLPYRVDTVTLLSDRISQVQNFLGRRILIENLSTYLTFKHSEMSEWEFISEIAKKADCGILLDINNIYVSSVNHGFNPLDYLHAIPKERVGQIHLAGHSKLTNENGLTYLIDTHDEPVCDEVWDLYRYSCHLLGGRSTMVERDGNFPEYKVIEAEVSKAAKIYHETLTQKGNHVRNFKTATTRDA